MGKNRKLNKTKNQIVKKRRALRAASLLVVIVASSVTGAVGLSPIVGALIAGLLIAETEYHEEVEAMTDPFKGLALGVFLIVKGVHHSSRGRRELDVHHR